MSLEDVKFRILARVPLPTLIGESVVLTSRSGRPIGLCPFHGEKTPSFHVYDDHYYCFGCKARGDAITWVRETQGLGFVDALRYLAGKYGVEASELDDQRQRRTDPSLYRLMAEAQEFFVQNLASALGAPSREYLLGRGFRQEDIKEYGFGLTPSEPFGLVRFLRQKGYKEEAMVEASMASTSEHGGRVYDFFRQRIMIPIRDVQGRVIAFGGRTLVDDPAKYKNSRATPLFDKSRTLFGLDRARTAMRRKGRAVIVEGYMDALALCSAGVDETVACLGTALTEEHLKALRHVTSQVILVLDGDRAGRKATLDAVTTTLATPDLMVKAVELPEGFDPDDFVRQKGVDALAKLLDGAASLLDMAVAARLREVGSDGARVPDIVNNEFVPWLAQLSDPIQRDFLMARIAQLTGIERVFIRARMKSLQLTAQGAGPSGQMGSPSSRAGASVVIPPLGRVNLSHAVIDLVGHLFYAKPGELDLEVVRQFMRQAWEAPAAVTAFAEELTQLLAENRVPADVPANAFLSLVDQDAAHLREKLVQAAPAFACVDRGERVKRLMQHFKVQKVKETIAVLRGDLARLTASRADPQEIHGILKSIKDLSAELGSQK